MHDDVMRKRDTNHGKVWIVNGVNGRDRSVSFWKNFTNTYVSVKTELT